MKARAYGAGTRREFLRASAATALLSGAGWLVSRQVLRAAEAPGSDPPGLVGSNVYGWTQYFQREGRKFDLMEVMGALRDGGYDYLEGFLDSGHPEANAQLAEQMKASGLRPVTLYTGGRMHESGPAKETVSRILAAAQVCRQAGFQLFSCNPDPIGRDKTDAELKNQVAALNDLGAGLKELGMRFGVHHHMPELASKARELHYVFRHTDPGLVGFNYDVHWLFRGGLPPAEVLPEYGARVVSWHLRQSRQGIWTEALSDGDIDYVAVARHAREHRLARVFTVELAMEQGTEITRSAFANHQRSREFVRQVFAA